MGNPPGTGIKVERGLRRERDEQEGREETQVYTVKICYSGWFNKKLIDQQPNRNSRQGNQTRRMMGEGG